MKYLVLALTSRCLFTTTTTASFASAFASRAASSSSARSIATTTQRRTHSSSSSTTATGLNMANNEVAVGDSLPNVIMKELTEVGGTPVSINLTEVCAGKKVAIFGVPGAFTPGCSKSHLPSFIDAQASLQDKGVDLTVCVATNDAYTMEAWGRTSGGTAAGIRFWSDADGSLTKALGLVMDTPVGIRTKRFSLIANDNKVTHYFSSANAASDTWAPNVLSAL